MITILNGKLTIPESERFIGFAGDNLRRTVNFLISGATEADHIYRLYLTFDDGTVNYFTLPSTLADEGVVLTWNVLLEHIFMSGSVKAQIKAFSPKGVVYHTTTDRFFVGDSAEFSDYFRKQNTEFLEYEEKLNNLKESVSDICVLMPFVGDNGNWYIYDADSGEYKDSGKPSVGLVDDLYVRTDMIEDSAVTGDKIAPGAVTSGKLGQYAVTNDAIAPSAVKENNLGSSAVTTGKIADDAVTEEKIADNSVDYNHLKDMAVTPEKLDREYLKLQGSVASLSGESQFYNYLITGADELSDPLKKICMFSIRAIGGWLAIVGTGRFYGFYVSPTEFVFTKLNNKYRTFRAVFDNEKIISIVRIDASFTSPDMALASDDIYDGYSIENRINYLIDSAVGDIDTVLDNIIAIQNSYIGGAEK